MSIINCPECDKEISNLAPNCPHCGYPINQEKAEQKVKDDIIKNLNFKLAKEKISKIFENKTAKIIICSLAILIIIGGVMGNHIDKYEQQAIDCTEKLASMMKDPNSFRLEDNVLVIYDETDCYVYIISSGTNSYGGRVSDISYFVNGEYIGNDDSDEFESSQEKLVFSKAKVNLSAWKLSESDYTDYYDSAKLVDKKKVAKKLHIDYM